MRSRSPLIQLTCGLTLAICLGCGSSGPSITPNAELKSLQRPNIQLKYTERVTEADAEKMIDYLENGKYWKIFVENLEWGKHNTGIAILDHNDHYEFRFVISEADKNALLDDEFGFKMAAIMIAGDVFPNSELTFHLCNEQYESEVTLEIPAEK